MKKLKRFYKRFLAPIIHVRPKNILAHVRYWKQLHSYQRMGGSIDVLWPILGEDTSTTGIDPHYFYQSIWAVRHIVQKNPNEHTDIGSQVSMVGILAAITNVQFVDLRPLSVSVKGLTVIPGSILALPFKDNSVESLSCLHVAEHIGLGRYGDPLDPNGTQKACAELSRVLALEGSLFFSLPIGHERTEFNAHRVHRPATIVSYFRDLTLIEFSAITDKGVFIEHANMDDFDAARYACGLFRFIKERKNA